MAKSILVVEDKDLPRITVEGILRDAGYKTHWTDASSLAWEYLTRSAYASALNGSEIVWEELKEDHYRLVVLDIDEIRVEPRGPALRQEGLRFLRRLRSDPRFSDTRLPVIGMTSKLPPLGGSYQEEFIKAGGNFFLEWPFDPTDLLDEVKRLIGDP